MDHVNQLREWMQHASSAEKKQLAELAGTTLGTLHQIAGGYRNNGSAATRPALARRIELACTLLNKRNKHLPLVLRTDLAPECRECEFAQKCLGQKALASGFDIISAE